jgi:hypothetical protein
MVLPYKKLELKPLRNEDPIERIQTSQRRQGKPGDYCLLIGLVSSICAHPQPALGCGSEVDMVRTMQVLLAEA